MKRLFLVLFLVLIYISCGQTGGCGGCVEPPESDFQDSMRIKHGGLIRITPAGIDFLNNNLSYLISAFTGGGDVIHIDVPPSQVQQGCVPYLGCVIDATVCENTCPIDARIVDQSLSLQAPNHISINLTLDIISGVITLRGTPDCDIDLAGIDSTPLEVGLDLRIDSEVSWLGYTVHMNWQLSPDNIQLSQGLCGNIENIDILKTLLVEAIQSNLVMGNQIQSAIDQARCLSCNAFSYGCPYQTTCTDNYCQGDSDCVPSPSGILGLVDTTNINGNDIFNSKVQPLFLHIIAGDRNDHQQEAFVRADGLDLPLLTGSYSERISHCAGPIPMHQREAPILPDIPDQFNSQNFHAGVFLSRQFFEELIWSLETGGFLCIDMGSDSVSILNSSTLSTIAPSIERLTHSQNVPALLRIRPTKAATVNINQQQIEETDDGYILNTPALSITIPDLAVDVYIVIEERILRVMTVLFDARLDIGLIITEDNNGVRQILPLFKDRGIVASNIRVINSELLSEDPQELADGFGSFIDMALDMLPITGLQPISIPDLSTGELSFDIVGDGPVAYNNEQDGSKTFLGFLFRFTDYSSNPITRSVSLVDFYCDSYACFAHFDNKDLLVGFSINHGVMIRARPKGDGLFIISTPLLKLLKEGEVHLVAYAKKAGLFYKQLEIDHPFKMQEKEKKTLYSTKEDNKYNELELKDLKSYGCSIPGTYDSGFLLFTLLILSQIMRRRWKGN